MAQAGDRPDSAVPETARHIPVMLVEVLASMAPLSGSLVLDGTFGAGGYARALLEAGSQVIALDRDPAAISGGAGLLADYPDHLNLHQARFSDMLSFSGEAGLDAIVLDIGVSSMQIDEAERGFSFMRDGPLDMRMAQSGVSAADVVNRMKVSDLTRVFGFLGEERHSGRIARAIEAARKNNAITTTKQLVGIIEKVSPRRAQDKIHPATRVFQALRAYVNDELGELASALFAAEAALKPGGRLVVVTFHSLEDRIVKRYFQARSGKAMGSRHMPMADETPAIFETPGKQPLKAGQDESDVNSRARSAKLRVGIRTDAAAKKPDFSILPLPELAALAAYGG